MINRDVELLAVRTDNAGEFRNVEGFADALVKTTGAVHETTPSRHHHAVGKASAMQLELARIGNHMMQRTSRNIGFLIYALIEANAVRNLRPVRNNKPRI